MKSLVKIEDRQAWIIALRKRIEFIEDYRKKEDEAYEKSWAEQYHRRHPWVRCMFGPLTEKPPPGGIDLEYGFYPSIKFWGVFDDAKALLKVLEDNHYTSDIYLDVETVNKFTSG